MVASLQAQLPQINAADSVLISADAEMRQEGLEKFLWGKGFRNEWKSVNKTEQFYPASGLEIIYFHDYTYLSAELSDGRKIFLHPVFTDSLLKENNSFLYSFKKDIHYSYAPYGYILYDLLSASAGLNYFSPHPVFISNEFLPNELKGKNLFYKTDRVFDNDQLLSSDELLKLLNEGKTLNIDTEKLLKLRTLDLFLKNPDSYASVFWKYHADSSIYIPERIFLPVSFFQTSGLLPTAAGIAGFTPPGINQKNLKPEKWNNKNIDYDLIFTGNTKLSDWQQAFKQMQQVLLSKWDSIALELNRFFPENNSQDYLLYHLKKRIENAGIELENYPEILAKYKYVLKHNSNQEFAVVLNSRNVRELIEEYPYTKEWRMIDFENKTLSSGVIKKRSRSVFWKEFKRDSIVLKEIPALSGYYSEKGFFPVADINFDDGLIIGAGLVSSSTGFLTLPYKTRHQVFAATSIPGGAFFGGYELEINNLIGKAALNLSVSGGIPAPVINFFGFGNETNYDPGLMKLSENHTHRHEFDAGIFLVLKPHEYWRISIGPAIQYNYLPEEKNKNFLINNYLPAEVLNNLYKTKYYGGGSFSLNFNNRKKKVFIQEGSYINLEIKAYKGMNHYSNDYAQINADLRKNFKTGTNSTFGFRIGGGLNLGDYEYFQSQFLSTHKNLRGYRRYRFAGDEILFTNLEYRNKIASFRGNILSGSWGWMLSADIGRVWYKGEHSTLWHKSAGPGVWLSPGDFFLVTGSVFFNKEMINPFISFRFFF